MFKRKQLRQAVAAAFLLTAGAGSLAFAAANENELVGTMGANDTIRTAEPLGFSAADCVGISVPLGKTCAVVNGVIGVEDPNAAAIPDVDFYTFEAKQHDTLRIDIDGGMHPFADPKLQRSVDTYLVIYGPYPDVTIRRESTTEPNPNVNSRGTVPLDDGSQHVGDALIRAFFVPRNGTYFVGVSSDPRAFVNGGGTENNIVTGRNAMFPNGRYKLTISGVTPLVQPINIVIKPGSSEKAPINLKAKGNIPVALLSHRASDKSEAFDALTVDTSTLTFGSTGNEYSYLRCSKEGLDVDADGLLDLVCHFDNQAAKWLSYDLEGTVKGKTKTGVAFEGTAPLKVLHKKE
jgi:Bacterial pre-peptidase C-terminal domain